MTHSVTEREGERALTTGGGGVIVKPFVWLFVPSSAPGSAEAAREESSPRRDAAFLAFLFRLLASSRSILRGSLLSLSSPFLIRFHPQPLPRPPLSSFIYIIPSRVLLFFLVSPSLSSSSSTLNSSLYVLSFILLLLFSLSLLRHPYLPFFLLFACSPPDCLAAVPSQKP